jgi:arylsulfatase A-like enzyme
MRLYRQALPVLAALFFAACASEESVPPVDKVLLISIDTLRADFLGVYNPKLDTSPHLDRFASDATVFTDVLSQASSTARSHKSLFYSLYPSVHKTSKSSVPEEKLVSPLEALQSAGFTTAGIVGGGQLKAEFGFSKGFDDYIELPPITEGNQLPALEEESFTWLAEHREDRFFLFLHTYEPHCPYRAPEEYVSKRAEWYEGRVDPGECGARYYNKLQMGSEDFRFVRDLYAAEVEYVDAFLGRLFDELKRLGLYDDMMIIFTSDHGESLGERRYVGHNRLYDVQLRIPLIVKLPDTAPSRIGAPVESIDVMAGLRRTESGSGSLVTAIRSPSTAARGT